MSSRDQKAQRPPPEVTSTESKSFPNRKDQWDPPPAILLRGESKSWCPKDLVPLGAYVFITSQYGIEETPPPD